jgi:hypothetical protein
VTLKNRGLVEFLIRIPAPEIITKTKRKNIQAGGEKSALSKDEVR